MNANHNWVAGGSALNEFVFQFSDYVNQVPATDTGPHLRFPNGVTAGTSPLAPQGTEQRKWQFRDDFSWTQTGLGGLGHVMKAGVNVIHEPHLFVSVGQGTSGIFTMGANDLNGPVTSILVIGGNTELNIPIDSYALFAQDDWRVNDRLTLEPRRAVGLRRRHSVQPGPQSKFPGAAGGGPYRPVCRDDPRGFRQGDRAATRTTCSRALGFVYDLHGTGREIIRGGWGIYTDFGYTNANVLTAAIDAAGGGGPGVRGDVAGRHSPTGRDVLPGVGPALGHRRAEPGQSQHPVARRRGRLAACSSSPIRFRPTSDGRARSTPSTSISVDYVRVDGRDLNLRAAAEHARRRPALSRRPRDPAERDRLPHGAQQGREPLRRADRGCAAPPVGPPRSERLRTPWRRRRATSAAPTTRSSRT